MSYKQAWDELNRVLDPGYTNCINHHCGIEDHQDEVDLLDCITKRFIENDSQTWREKLQNEIDHAISNGHCLDRDCQGVGPGEQVSAVRVSYLQAILKSTSQIGNADG